MRRPHVSCVASRRPNDVRCMCGCRGVEAAARRWVTAVKSPPSGHVRDLLERDGVDEGLEAADEPALESVLVAAVEVVTAEVVEIGAILEEVVTDDQDRVGDRDGGPLLAPAGSQAMVLRAEVGVAGATGRLGRLDEGRVQIAVALT